MDVTIVEMGVEEKMAPEDLPIAWVISHLWSENSPVNYNSQTARSRRKMQAR